MTKVGVTKGGCEDAPKRTAWPNGKVQRPSEEKLVNGFDSPRNTDQNDGQCENEDALKGLVLAYHLSAVRLACLCSMAEGLIHFTLQTGDVLLGGSHQA